MGKGFGVSSWLTQAMLLFSFVEQNVDLPIMLSFKQPNAVCKNSVILGLTNSLNIWPKVYFAIFLDNIVETLATFSAAVHVI